MKLPKIGEKYRHTTSGRIYWVITITNITSTRKEYPVTIVYENVDNGSLWSRPASDWWRSFKEWAE